MKKTDLTIVILNYNTQFWLKKTLTTLKQQYLSQTKYGVSVVVVDNNSSDNSVEMVKSDFSWVKLLASQTNSGYAAGNNLALQEVDSPYVMLLNSDVECIAESNFDVLIQYLDEHPETAVITPLILMSDGNIDLACHRGEPTLWPAFTYFSRLEKLFPYIKHFSGYHQLYKGLSDTHQVDACSGAAMIVRTSAMNQVGLLDERFFMYAEDLDWCKRFRDAGYTVIFNPEVKVIHHKYKSGISSLSNQTSAKTKIHFYETMLQYYDKHYQSRYPAWVRQVIHHFVELQKGAA